MSWNGGLSVLDDPAELAEAACDLVSDELHEIAARAQMPLPIFLAGAHAAIVALMVAEIGGRATARCCESAADRVRNMPSQHDLDLAAMPQAGSA